MSELLSIGVSQRTAAIDLRERLALSGGREPAMLDELARLESIAEVAAVSTCNRTEIYLVARDAVEAEGVVLGALARRAEIGATELAGSLRTWRGGDAARHLLRVAAGLESMILGEAEIQGQLKRAYERSLAEGTSGAILNRLFRDALRAGKRVREETKLGEGVVSVASAAVELARRTVGELSELRVLVIGAGETAELTAAALAARGVETVIVANRRYDRAVGLAERYRGTAHRLEELSTELELADLVIASTNSPHHIVERAELEPALERRRRDNAGRDRPLLLVDLAVPRDIDPECGAIAGVVVRDVDDVQGVADAGLAAREAAVGPAEAVVEAELNGFGLWLGSLRAVPTITALRERGEAVAARVIDENRAFLRSLAPEDRERAEAMLGSLLGRFLHDPTLRLRREAEAPGGHEDYELQRRLATIRALFGLDPESEAPADRVGGVTDLDAYRRVRSRPADGDR